MTIIEALVRLRNDLKLWVANNLRMKVDKEDGKGLSSNDYTTEEKTKLGKLSIDSNNLLVSNAYTLGDTVSYFKTGYRYRKTYTFPAEDSKTYYIKLQTHYGNSEQRYNIDAMCNNSGNRIFFTVNARPYMQASIYGKTLDYNSRDITSVAVYQNEYYHDLVVTVVTKPTAATTIDIYSDGNFTLDTSCISTTAPTGTKECEYVLTAEDKMFSTAPIVSNGKVMSTNDFTTAEKEKLASLDEELAKVKEDAANKDTVVLSETQKGLSTKVNITDIVDNLTTDSATQPLSAAQGKALKTAIDDNKFITHDSRMNATTLCFSIEGNGTSTTTRYPMTLTISSHSGWFGYYQWNAKLDNGAPVSNETLRYGHLPPIDAFWYSTNGNVTTYMLKFSAGNTMWGHGLVGCYPGFKFTDKPDQVLESGTALFANYGVTCDNIGALPSVLTSSYYGTTLPAAGTAGRIFFKKVSS